MDREDRGRNVEGCTTVNAMADDEDENAVIRGIFGPVEDKERIARERVAAFHVLKKR